MSRPVPAPCERRSQDEDHIFPCRIAQGGKVGLPPYVRDALQVGPNYKVTITLDGDGIHLRRAAQGESKP